MLSSDIDPLEHKTEAHKNTVEHVANEWLKIKKSKITHDYSEDIQPSLALHIFPKIGTFPIHEVKARDAIETLKPFPQRALSRQ